MNGDGLPPPGVSGVLLSVQHPRSERCEACPFDFWRAPTALQYSYCSRISQCEFFSSIVHCSYKTVPYIS